MNQTCIACGANLGANDACCRACGFDENRRQFLNMEDYEAWKRDVLEPFKRSIKPIQLFPGYQHMLILCGNGDLYAIGNNASGACGDDLPDKLPHPTLIASGVRHAAAGYRHSLYVNTRGEVILIGRSDFADRFSCAFPVCKVYAHSTKDVFALEDEQGKFWIFGDPGEAGLESPASQVLKTLEETSYEYTDNDTWVQPAGSSFVTGESHYRSPKPDAAIALPSVQQYMRSEEYRQFVREYGNANIEIRFGKHKCDIVDRQLYHKDYNRKHLVSTYRCTCQPEVVLHGHHLYKPVRAKYFAVRGWIGCCWPIQVEEFDHLSSDMPVTEHISGRKCITLENRYVTLDQRCRLNVIDKQKEFASEPVPDITEFALFGDDHLADRVVALTANQELVIFSVKELLENAHSAPLEAFCYQKEERKWISAT